MCGAHADIVPIAALAKEKNIFLLEDCAQAVGGSVNGRKLGSFGDMAIFSFQVNKNMTSGEAGAIVTNNQALYRRAVASHDIGYSRGPTGNLLTSDDESLSWGRGCRLDELRAAILRVQLKRLPRTIEHMRASKSRICRFLERQPGIQLRRIVDPAGDTGCFLIVTFRSAEVARLVNERLHFHSITCAAQDPSTVILSDYGLHIYSNIAALVRRRPLRPQPTDVDSILHPRRRRRPDCRGVQGRIGRVSTIISVPRACGFPVAINCAIILFVNNWHVGRMLKHRFRDGVA
jgi:8-amino-3,8-dideoxy-alpha-D-manno-octulosonate transaminase